jgi:Tfp pilus assembly protein PilZ
MSPRAPRVEHGEVARVVAPGASWTGRASNLSTGGAFITGGPALDVGRRVSVTLELGDGDAAVEVHARVVRCTVPGGDGPPGIGVRFVRLADGDARRIAQLVEQRTVAAARPIVHEAVRVQLAGLPMRLRAQAREVQPGTLVVEAELAWLRVGSAVATEVEPGHVRGGRLQWVGVELAPSGTARLCLHVELTDDTLDLASADDDGDDADGDEATAAAAAAPG